MAATIRWRYDACLLPLFEVRVPPTHLNRRSRRTRRNRKRTSDCKLFQPPDTRLDRGSGNGAPSYKSCRSRLRPATFLAVFRVIEFFPSALCSGLSFFVTFVTFCSKPFCGSLFPLNRPVESINAVSEACLPWPTPSLDRARRHRRLSRSFALRGGPVRARRGSPDPAGMPDRRSPSSTTGSGLNGLCIREVRRKGRRPTGQALGRGRETHAQRRGRARGRGRETHAQRGRRSGS
jgi:hypothetical protein